MGIYPTGQEGRGLWREQRDGKPGILGNDRQPYVVRAWAAREGRVGKTCVLCSSFVPRVWVLTRGVSQYLQTSKKNFLVAACGINSLLRDQTPGPLHWECRVLAIGPPGKSLKTFLIVTTRKIGVPLPCAGQDEGEHPECSGQLSPAHQRTVQPQLPRWG